MSLRASFWRSIVMGMLCCPVGLLVGYFIMRGAIGDGWQTFRYYSGAAAFVAPASLWWLLVEKNQAYGIVRGLLAGAVSALFSHYIAWYLQIIVSNISYWLLIPTGRDSLGEAPIDPLNGLWGALVLSLWSWFLVGWVTIPIGAIIGGLYSWRSRKRASSP